MADADTVKTLDVSTSRTNVLENVVSEVRYLTTCKICLKPFYEPYVLACGHTYCYGCLKSWFGEIPHDKKKRKNCPDCRTEVTAQPAPNYLLRDLVHLLVNRTELLPEDETAEDHRLGKEEEATLLTNDKAGTGIFGGVFKRPKRVHMHYPLIDHEDNVERCPACGWELEGVPSCFRCGWSMEEEEDFSDLSDSDLDDGISDVSTNALNEIMMHGPQRFYGISSETDDTESDIDDYDTSRPVIDLDHYDENDDFIDNNDYSDEVDHDDIDGLSPVSITSDEEDFIPTIHTAVRHDRRLRTVPDSSSVVSDNETGTNYDNSDAENDVAVNTNRYIPRRGRRVISDGEDDDDDDDDEDDEDSDDSEASRRIPAINPENTTSAHVPTSSSTDVSTSLLSDTDSSLVSISPDEEESDEDDSDDTVIPPQPRNRRRQRLDSHRSRRTQATEPFGYSVSNAARNYGRQPRSSRPSARRSQVGYVY